jgi:hypothetical protein
MDRRQFLLAGSSLLAARCRSHAPEPRRARPPAIGYIPVIGTAPIFVANGEGWLKEAGINAAFTVFESGPNMIQALASGTIDLYVAGIAPLAVARSRGVDIRVVAATATGENVFVAAPALAKFFTPGTSACGRLQGAQGRERQAGAPRDAAGRLGAEHRACNTGSGRSPRPTRPMSRSCRWASTRPSRPCSLPPSRVRSCASRR